MLSELGQEDADSFTMQELLDYKGFNNEGMLFIRKAIFQIANPQEFEEEAQATQDEKLEEVSQPIEEPIQESFKEPVQEPAQGPIQESVLDTIPIPVQEGMELIKEAVEIIIEGNQPEEDVIQDKKLDKDS